MATTHHPLSLHTSSEPRLEKTSSIEEDADINPSTAGDKISLFSQTSTQTTAGRYSSTTRSTTSLPQTILHPESYDGTFPDDIPDTLPVLKSDNPLAKVFREVQHPLNEYLDHKFASFFSTLVMMMNGPHLRHLHVCATSISKHSLLIV